MSSFDAAPIDLGLDPSAPKANSMVLLADCEASGAYKTRVC